uniref:Cell cycle progression protein 1 n=1 Tax=Cyprinus carpio carpio TaxID=630221 RepID=A0A9J7XWR6_CYPCA
MSDSSSDTESSCGWTVISNEGSDIENLGPDNAGECEDEAVGHALDVPDAKQGEESLRESSLDLTLREEAEPAREAGGEEHVILCSSSENSDIITLADSQEAEIDTWVEPVAKEAEEEAGSEELYLGSSSSSQYTFRESETIFPADQPVQRDSGNSSSEDEDEEGEVKASPVVRRRRVRRSTAGSEPGDPQEPHRRQEEAVEGLAVHPEGRAARQNQGPVSGTLNKCILLALLIAISMGFGHFYGLRNSSVCMYTRMSQPRMRLCGKP